MRCCTMVRPHCRFLSDFRLTPPVGWVDVYDLKYWSYDPNWREEINEDVPPSPMLLAPGVQDAEFD